MCSILCLPLFGIFGIYKYRVWRKVKRQENRYCNWKKSKMQLLLPCTRYGAADCAAYLGVPGPPPTLKGTPTVEIYLQDCTQLFCISRGFFVVAVAVSVVVAVPIVVLEVFE